MACPDVGPDDNDDSQHSGGTKNVKSPDSQGPRFSVTSHQDQGLAKIKATKSEQARQLHFIAAKFNLDNEQGSSLKRDKNFSSYRFPKIKVL